MGNYWTNPVRHPEDTGMQYVRRTVTFNMTDTGGAAIGTNPGIPMGALEAGAIPLYCHVTIETAFNAGTTNVLIVGTLADDDALVAAAGVDETAVALTRVTPATLAGLVAPTADTAIYTKYTQTGTAASAGEAIVVVEYVVDNDQ
mgnify:CR=1 FL=1